MELVFCLETSILPVLTALHSSRITSGNVENRAMTRYQWEAQTLPSHIAGCLLRKVIQARGITGWGETAGEVDLAVMVYNRSYIPYVSRLPTPFVFSYQLKIWHRFENTYCWAEDLQRCKEMANPFPSEASWSVLSFHFIQQVCFWCRYTSGVEMGFGP